MEARVDFFQMAGAVMLGNLMAAAFIASVIRSLKQDYAEASWLTIAGIVLPMLAGLGALITAEGPPQFLSAIISQ
jgi:cytochrome bd-type quinol oxidase subunit 1